METTEKVVKSSLVLNTLVTYKGKTRQKQNKNKTETFNVRCLDESETFRLVEISDDDCVSFFVLFDVVQQKFARVNKTMISKAKKEKNLQWETDLSSILKKEFECGLEDQVQTLKIQSVDRVVKTIREEKVSMTESQAFSSVEVVVVDDDNNNEDDNHDDDTGLYDSNSECFECGEHRTECEC